MNIGTVSHSEIISMALDSIKTHKFRSALTVLGIVIGVSTVIAIASILTGLRENLVKLIQEYGTDNIYAFHLWNNVKLAAQNTTQRLLSNAYVSEDAQKLRKLIRTDEGKDVEGLLLSRLRPEISTMFREYQGSQKNLSAFTKYDLFRISESICLFEQLYS